MKEEEKALLSFEDKDGNNRQIFNKDLTDKVQPLVVEIQQDLKKAKAKPSIVIIYGPSGLGKTTLAVGSKDPIVIQTEEGLGILTKNRDIPHFPLAKDYDTFYGYLKSLVDEKELPYSSLILDSLDWLEPLIHQKTCETD